MDGISDSFLTHFYLFIRKPLHVNSYASLARPMHSNAGFEKNHESEYLTFPVLQWEVSKGKRYQKWLSMP